MATKRALSAQSVRVRGSPTLVCLPHHQARTHGTLRAPVWSVIRITPSQRRIPGARAYTMVPEVSPPDAGDTDRSTELTTLDTNSTELTANLKTQGNVGPRNSVTPQASLSFSSQSRTFVSSFGSVVLSATQSTLARSLANQGASHDLVHSSMPPLHPLTLPQAVQLLAL